MNKWDNYFMEVAKDTATLSKDPKTKVGAVITEGKKILSIGFNGAPRNFPDELVPEGEGKTLLEQKNTFMCHAELNAILNYRGQIKDLKGASIYTTVSPCCNCVLALAQVGINNVIYLEEYHREEITNTAKYIMDKCGIKYRRFGDSNEN